MSFVPVVYAANTPGPARAWSQIMMRSTSSRLISAIFAQRNEKGGVSPKGKIGHCRGGQGKQCGAPAPLVGGVPGAERAAPAMTYSSALPEKVGPDCSGP